MSAGRDQRPRDRYGLTDAQRYRLFRAVVRLGQWAALPTAGQRVEPDFLIVGAQRAGTTTLYRVLQEHPAVRFPRFTKGVHWFDVEYHRSPSWYRSNFPLRRTIDAQAAAAGEPVRVGEAAPYYAFHPFAPARIAERLPGVKVVMILRDPVTRAWSQFHHERGRGWEVLSDFEAALEAEPARLAGAERVLAHRPGRHLAHQHNSYVARGRYREQVERLWAAVGRDQVLLLTTDELEQSPEATVARLQEFLGLSARPLAPGRWNARSQSRADVPAAAVERIRAATADSDAWLRTVLPTPPPWTRP